MSLPPGTPVKVIEPDSHYYGNQYIVLDRNEVPRDGRSQEWFDSWDYFVGYPGNYKGRGIAFMADELEAC